MDTDDLFLIIIFSILFLIAIIATIRDIFFSRKEDYRKIHTVGDVNGKEIVERMLKDNQIEPIKIKAYDRMLDRYYYRPNQREIVMSSHACYGSGLYETIRAAHLCSHVIQREKAYKSIDIYLWLAPVFEVWVRLVPMLYIFLLFLASIFPYVPLCILLILYVVTVLTALFMLPIELNASDISCRWIEDNGLVADADREQLRKVSRYVSKYNLICAVTSLVAYVGGRRRVIHSDVSI